MGYYTRYELKHDCRDIVTADKICNEETNYGSLKGLMNCDWDDCKWYEHEEEMRAISAQFPDVLFTLTGAGEETGDLWIKYFKNGKMQDCQGRIVYDDYDPDKLI